MPFSFRTVCQCHYILEMEYYMREENVELRLHGYDIQLCLFIMFAIWFLLS